jgi:hypothetical protein
MAQYTYSGVRGYQFRITLTENVGTPAQNYSTISWTIEHYQGSYTYDTVGARIRYLTINGTNVYYENARYDSTVYSNNSWWTVASGTSGTIPHNNDGTGSFNWVFYWDGYASSFGPNNTLGQGVTSGTQTFTMTTINRYAVITRGTIATTDVGITVPITTDATCDTIYLSLDNGSTYPYTSAGDFTSKSISTTGQLPSNTSYTCYVAAKRKDSQLITYSGPFTATTETQNNFMGFIGI